MRSGTTVRMRHLARRLKALRQEAGLTIERAAPALDWPPSKLSRIENAHQFVDTHSVRGMLDLYQVGGELWAELVELAREAKKRGWWQAYGVDDQGYLPLEAEATSVRDFTTAVIPGLLQTPRYTRALFEAGLHPWSEERLEDEITVRTIRQQRLTSEQRPLQLMAVMEEGALHRSAGGCDVMGGQLLRLVEAARLSTVTLQVLPTALGLHPALGGDFTVLSFDDLGEPDMAYVEHPMGSVHIEKAAEVTRATLVFDHLRALALGPTESVALLEGVVTQL